MKIINILYLLAIVSLTSCIGDDFINDFVKPELRISTLPESIAVGETYQIDVDFFNDIGQKSQNELEFTTSDSNIFTIDGEGIIAAIAVGSGVLTISTTYKDITYTNTATVTVAQATVISEPEVKIGDINTTSSYLLDGSFTVESTENGITIKVAEDYVASTALPGLYVYLTNNPSTNNGAFEIGKVDVFEGAHTYNVDNVNIDDYSHLLYYCKPFGVKVGDGAYE